MSMRIGLTMSVMAACMLPGFAYAQGGVQTQKDITWGLGLEIAQAAIAECAKRNVAISVAVVDRAGRMRVFMATSPRSPSTTRTSRGVVCRGGIESITRTAPSAVSKSVSKTSVPSR